MIGEKSPGTTDDGSSPGRAAGDSPVTVLIAQNLLPVSRGPCYWGGLMRSTAATCRRVGRRIALLGKGERGGSNRESNREGQSLHAGHFVVSDVPDYQ